MANIRLVRQDHKSDDIYLRVGDNVVGRYTLQSDDVHISRKHVLIRVQENGTITMKQLHPNRSYYRSKEDNDRYSVREGEEIDIHNGDKLEFLPSKYCYKFVVSSGEAPKESQRTEIPKMGTDSLANAGSVLTVGFSSSLTSNSKRFIDIEESVVDMPKRQRHCEGSTEDIAAEPDDDENVKESEKDE